MRKRNHIIPLHLNKKELAHLEAQVKTSGLPREEFLRTLIMGAELRARPCDHHTDLLQGGWVVQQRKPACQGR